MLDILLRIMYMRVRVTGRGGGRVECVEFY